MAKELLGQFLIRRQKVTQQDIEEALILQEILHDSLGAAALATDVISFTQVGNILEYMDRYKTDFSNSALTLKYMSAEQIEELKVKAGDCQFRLGQLLVATTKMTQPELDGELSFFNSERLLISSPNVTKADLIGRVAAMTGLDRKALKEVIEKALEVIAAELGDNGAVVLKGFGTFTTAKYAAREGRNPRTGKPLKIGPKRAVQLRFSKNLRRRVD